MSLSLGSNIAALGAQGRLASASHGLSSALERLASGQRINRASDDAAGLSIADSLRSQSRIYAQAVRNLNDGISVLAIASSSLDTLSAIVTRISELSEQAANGTYGQKQRSALNAEAQALAEEFLRIAQSTEFNGRQLFSAGFGQLSLQAGSGDNSSLTSGLGGAIGTGQFTAGALYPTLSFDLVSGDFNGDGNADLISGSGSGVVNVHLGTGHGSFLEAVSYSNGGGNAFRLEVGDFNGDGTFDIASANPTASTYSVLLGNGDGTFAAPLVGTAGPALGNISAGDFNNDGIDDLITTHFAGYAKIYIGKGNGTFADGVTVSSSGPSPEDVAVGDFDGDGNMDLAIANGAGNTVTVRRGRGDGSFDAGVNYFVEAFPASVNTADINRDGNADLVTGSRTLLGNGDGTFRNGAALTGSGDSIISDFNGDGNQDVATSDAIYLGNGDGTFSNHGPFSGGDEVAVGDFNNDGVNDLISSGQIYHANTLQGVGALLSFSLESVASARQALSQMKHKQAQLSQQRGALGAFESRISVASAVLEVLNETTQAAESRIRDADISIETSEVIRKSILARSAAAVLAQANLQPALALRLLSNATPSIG